MAAARRSSGRPVRPPPGHICALLMRAALHPSAARVSHGSRSSYLGYSQRPNSTFNCTVFTRVSLSPSHAGGRNQPRRGVSIRGDRPDQAHGRRVRPAAIGARARKRCCTR